MPSQHDMTYPKQRRHAFPIRINLLPIVVEASEAAPRLEQPCIVCMYNLIVIVDSLCCHWPISFRLGFAAVIRNTV